MQDLKTKPAIAALFDLSGKAAFVSGASSGIGLHTAQRLAEAGAAVTLAARRVDRLHSEVGRLRKAGYTANAVALDVTRPETIAEAMDWAESQLGQPIDILFNNAGILYAERFVAQKAAEVARIIDTNLTGAFLVAQEGAKRMAARRSGSIINVASTSGLRAGGQLSSYGASKAGLIHLTRIMALELAHRGVRVNALCPGNIRTEMHQTFEEKGFEESLLKRIPMRAIGEVEQLDGATLLLASDASSYMTGAVIPVDGGQLLSWM
ncbi:2-deoxy-D-gluconate 3-dehydrogenase (plasmid) [Sphingopyxis macrogoltabida]|nr:2-deoxy-D-gluconate 3-dehydrogenase [Sphingopyxis macrogoltabida]